MIHHPLSDAPKAGETIEVAPGIHWAKLPLPFQLNHVNVYLIEDGDGFAVIDTGIGNDACKEAWAALLAGPFKGKRLTRVIATHFHPDHIGLAGWLCETHGIPLLTTMTSFLQANFLLGKPDATSIANHVLFHTRRGMDETTAQGISTGGHHYLQMVSRLPGTYLRLLHGDTLSIGDRRFQVLTADGHAPEQAMLYLASEKILFVADQVLARISPNVSIMPSDPKGDPLGHYLRALRGIQKGLPDDVFVLPGHELPFYGLHTRCRELVDHHQARCRQILDACADAPKTNAELTKILFPRPLDLQQLGFAFTESLAHANRLVRRGDLKWQEQDGILFGMTVQNNA